MYLILKTSNPLFERLTCTYHLDDLIMKKPIYIVSLQDIKKLCERGSSYYKSPLPYGKRFQTSSPILKSKSSI